MLNKENKDAIYFTLSEIYENIIDTYSWIRDKKRVYHHRRKLWNINDKLSIAACSVFKIVTQNQPGLLLQMMN
jgi:hypothetical protein